MVYLSLFLTLLGSTSSYMLETSSSGIPVDLFLGETKRRWLVGCITVLTAAAVRPSLFIHDSSHPYLPTQLVFVAWLVVWPDHHTRGIWGPNHYVLLRKELLHLSIYHNWQGNTKDTWIYHTCLLASIVPIPDIRSVAPVMIMALLFSAGHLTQEIWSLKCSRGSYRV